MKTRILLVDDEASARLLFEELFYDKPIELVTAVNVAEARQAFHSADFNLAILDQRLPDGNGLSLFAEMRRERPRQLALLITGHAEVRDAVRAVREGLFDYLTKPFNNLEELEAVIDKALEMDQAFREIAKLRRTLEDEKQGNVPPIVVGRSAAMARLLHQVEQAGPLDTNVVIEGESGSGKEVIVRQLHAVNERSKKSLVEVNCGALSESLLEAALFGFEKGAFTGANKTTAGYFEEADGGTLFLDEITDMSPKLQVSLLRVLQERTFARIGSTVQRATDFRLICATNKSLETETKEGRFREDLFYRINVVTIQVPPLRKRQKDIMPLAWSFLDHFNRKFGRDIGPFTPDAIAALEGAYWAGNVRELQNVVERAVVIKAGGPINSEDLGMSNTDDRTIDKVAQPATPLRFRIARERFELEYFENLLKISGGNVSEVARLSGITRQNLYPYFNRLGVLKK
ncbi:MAG: sigma-54 dependent transcriptional regulator [Proteobacteria bacterium]|nr:sigma-54 dependent transcriptional regulator [Pseudomonadota bacterium]